jgi:hypothetical protein
MGGDVSRGGVRGGAHPGLGEELVCQAGEHEPHGDGEPDGEQDAVEGPEPARPGGLFNAGMLGALLAAQVVWFAAIGYGIYVFVQ